MKVAFVMPGIGVEARGAEAFVLELAEALVHREGLEVEIFSRGPAPLTHHRLRALPRDRRWLVRLYRASTLGRKVLDTLFLDPLNVEWATASLSAFPGLLRGRFDVVVMEGGLVGAWLCRLLRRLRGTPFVDIAHGLSPKWEGAFARQRPDRVVVFTATAAEMIRQRAPRARLQVIPHGIDLELFRPGLKPMETSLEAPVVMTAGAVDDHKRPDLALEAVAALVRRRGRGSLLVLGEGSGGAALDEKARTLLGPGRYLRATARREDMPRWYAAADVFTLPSRSESFGLAYLEAMACGLPVVAPDDGVRREVVGEAGILTAVDDAEAYARALGEALDRAWDELPREQAQRFPFAATAHAYAELFRTLSAERSRR